MFSDRSAAEQTVTTESSWRGACRRGAGGSREGSFRRLPLRRYGPPRAQALRTPRTSDDLGLGYTPSPTESEEADFVASGPTVRPTSRAGDRRSDDLPAESGWPFSGTSCAGPPDLATSTSSAPGDSLPTLPIADPAYRRFGYSELGRELSEQSPARSQLAHFFDLTIGESGPKVGFSLG